jgi:general secretion pathway protein E
VLPVTEGIRKLIKPECDTEAIRDVARKEGMVTLRENAIRKLLDGRTTYQEVMRVTWEQL